MRRWVTNMPLTKWHITLLYLIVECKTMDYQLPLITWKKWKTKSAIFTCYGPTYWDYISTDLANFSLFFILSDHFRLWTMRRFPMGTHLSHTLCHFTNTCLLLQFHSLGLHSNGLSQFFSFLYLIWSFQTSNCEETPYRNSLISYPSPLHKHVLASWWTLFH